MIGALGEVDEDSSSGTNSYSSATGDDILVAYLIGWEHSEIYNYKYKGQEASCIEDGKYICYTDYDYDAGDRNYGPGVCHRDTSGNYMQTAEYKTFGIDIASGEYDDVGVDMIDMEIVDGVFKLLLENRFMQQVLDETEGYNLTEYQLHALTCVAYQYGNVDGAGEFMASGATDRNAFWVSDGYGGVYNPFAVGGGKGGDERVNANWQLFSEGIYQIRSGEILNPANFGANTSGSSAGIITGSGNFVKYNLTESQLESLAYLCYREQGSLKGAAAEASLMANLFEIKGSYYGTGANGLYNYVRNDGWFANSKTYMDNPQNMPEYIKVVKAVLVNGKRTVPGYIDEHDYIGDIISATNNGSSINIKNESAYKQHVTEIYTKYGATYTFYSFPAPNSDPFGYTSNSYRQQVGDAYYDYDTGKLVNGDTSGTTESST